MRSRRSSDFIEAYESLPPDTRALVDKAYALWRENDRHPSLHFKRVGKTEPVWSVRINRNLRALALKEPDGGYFWFWLGPHDEYEDIIAGSDD
ncbi:MAG: hypothetical protein ACKO1J_16995 [Tagaea sp.]